MKHSFITGVNFLVDYLWFHKSNIFGKILQYKVVTILAGPVG
jgi:hypothetical protein